MDKLWGQAREELQKIVGADSFATWIEPLRLTGVEGTATIACPTRFLSDWVSRHYSGDILKVLDRIEGPVQRLHFETRAQTARAGRRARQARSGPAPGRQ
jgi:chromosomal replication initiator protein